MADEIPRSRAARAAAESALVNVVYHYGEQPEFIILGGLVPELLCTNSKFEHAGTTDVDVQMNMEIACGSVNSKRLENALEKAGFEPDNEHIWRWKTSNINTTGSIVIKFELLADLDDVAEYTPVKFENCEKLGAANLRGTRYVLHDFKVINLESDINGKKIECSIKTAGLAGFLLAKCAAAHARNKPKDWYDIAFVLLHNDRGGPNKAVEAVMKHFESGLAGVQTSLKELYANFETTDAQGSLAYANQMLSNHPDQDKKTLLADAVLAVKTFCDGLITK